MIGAGWGAAKMAVGPRASHVACGVGYCHGPPCWGGGDGGEMRSCCWQARRERSWREAAQWARWGGCRSGPCPPGSGGPRAGRGLPGGDTATPSAAERRACWALNGVRSLLEERLPPGNAHSPSRAHLRNPSSQKPLNPRLTHCGVPRDRRGEQHSSVPRPGPHQQCGATRPGHRALCSTGCRLSSIC